jgi:hypothetical protein
MEGATVERASRRENTQEFEGLSTRRGVISNNALLEVEHGFLKEDDHG